MGQPFHAAQPSLQIPLPQTAAPDWTPMYVQGRQRHATATSVRLIDHHTLVCCHLLGMQAYLVTFDLDASTHEVVDQVQTTFRHKPTQTDLCDVDDRGRVITSNCKSASMTLYRVHAGRIEHVRDLPTHRANYCHGARFTPHPGVVAAALLGEPMGVYLYDESTMRERLYVATRRRPKDVCFLSPTRMAIATTSSQPENDHRTQSETSAVVLIEFNLANGRYQEICEQEFPRGQFDSVTAHAGQLYVADSYADQVLVLDASTLQQVDTYDELSFPHGVDVRYGILAVACYGDGSVHLRRVKNT